MYFGDGTRCTTSGPSRTTSRRDPQRPPVQGRGRGHRPLGLQRAHPHPARRPEGRGHQSNRNLVLTEGAGAESIPNLEIEANDVRCRHASTVGPIDDDQRYYLETRGVPPEDAERLIVLGFFEDVSTASRSRRSAAPLRRARHREGRAPPRCDAMSDRRARSAGSTTSRPAPPGGSTSTATASASSASATTGT